MNTLFDVETAEQLREEEFEEYLYQHPAVWPAFKQRALAQIKAGAKRLSAKFIVELLRVDVFIQKSGDEFKIDNRYTADLARKFNSTYPQHSGLFKLKKRTVV